MRRPAPRFHGISLRGALCSRESNAGRAHHCGTLTRIAQVTPTVSGFERYVGTRVVAAIDARPSFTGVAGVRMVVSVLHADPRGYTTVAEALPPDEVLRVLLRYHGAAVLALQCRRHSIVSSAIRS